MRFPFLLFTAMILSTSAGYLGSPAQGAENPGLAAALQSPQRSPKFVSRDAVRHPGEELDFFGVRPNATVVEIWPGGGYWTEILAPYLKAAGTLYVATPEGAPDEVKSALAFRKRLQADPAVFGKVKFTSLGLGSFDIAPAGSADFVLTFRNVHNWMAQGYAEKAFSAFYAALKPGGILGVEEHRGDASRPQDPKAEDGYVREDYAIQLATAAGFHLIGKSEINANPKDTKHWPQGVWTLPPTFALGAQDHARYAAIGEADNFVLRFRK